MSSPEERVLAYLKERSEFYSTHYMASVGVIYAEGAAVIEQLRRELDALTLSEREGWRYAEECEQRYKAADAERIRALESLVDVDVLRAERDRWMEDARARAVNTVYWRERSESAERERDSLKIQANSFRQEKDAACAERDALKAERDALRELLWLWLQIAESGGDVNGLVERTTAALKAGEER